MVTHRGGTDDFPPKTLPALSVFPENRRCAVALAKAQEARLWDGSLPLAAARHRRFRVQIILASQTLSRGIIGATLS